MRPLKSYLIEAIWNWCEDTGYTPYIVVAVDDDCVVPAAYVEKGQIVFDISDEAVVGLTFEDDGISFEARFGETPMKCWAPYDNIAGAFPQEDPSQGLFFGFDPEAKKKAKAPKEKEGGAQETTKPSFSRVK